MCRIDFKILLYDKHILHGVTITRDGVCVCVCSVSIPQTWFACFWTAMNRKRPICAWAAAAVVVVCWLHERTLAFPRLAPLALLPTTCRRRTRFCHCRSKVHRPHRAKRVTTQRFPTTTITITPASPAVNTVGRPPRPAGLSLVVRRRYCVERPQPIDPLR